MKNKKIIKFKNFVKNKIVEFDSKTLNSNLTGIEFVKEVCTFAAFRFIKNKQKISKIDGYLVPGQEYFLLKKAYDLKDKSIIVEIGSYKGKSTVCMALGCLGTKKKIFAIDTFKGNDGDFYNFKSGRKYTKGFYSTFKSNLAKIGVEKYVQAIKGNSADVGKKWKGKIDMLFIDASHEYEDVLNDYKTFYPFVQKDGLIIFHDVLQEFPGVLKVWKNYAQKDLKKTGMFLSFAYGYK